jgi:hypothetical protein
LTRSHLTRGRYASLVLALAVAALTVPSATAADSPVTGTWKLTLVVPFTETELFLFDVKEHDGKTEATIKDSMRLPESPRVTEVKKDKTGLTVKMHVVNNDAVFHGTADADGVYFGTLKVGEQSIPARVEMTKAEKVAPPSPQSQQTVQAYSGLRFEKNMKAKVSKLMELAAKNAGSPSLASVYMDLIHDAEAGGLSEADVRKYAQEWIKGTRAYGEALGTETTVRVANTLVASKSFPKYAFELAEAAEKSLPADASVQLRATAAETLVAAARAAGESATLAAAEKRLSALEGELDADYHKRVPPFKPEPSAASKARKSDRVVVMELFTGAQCPPCIAADVAFEVLNGTYKPTELVTLQYHLHIPGPDPLTNADTENRAKYYDDLTGTPGTYFDGKTEAGGGGGMANAKGKYDEYKKIIDEALSKASEATVDVKAVRNGDDLTITATADAKNAKKDAKLHLRLFLVEEQVRYTGGNNLRFHEHVVRGMPGGVDGKTLSDGAGKAEVTVNLGELRSSLEKYLSAPTERGPYPKALPPIKLANLSVVALVQDDSDKSILNASIVKVPEAKVATP